jgi:hypothetical protein
MRRVQDSITAIVTFFAGDGRQALQDWRLKGRLRAMLADEKFPKGFRSTRQLQDGIGVDRETTIRLLHAIHARRSEIKDAWTLAPPEEPQLPTQNYTLY